MLNPFKPPVLWRQMLLWALLPVLILSLALAVACGDDEPTAAYRRTYRRTNLPTRGGRV